MCEPYSTARPPASHAVPELDVHPTSRGEQRWRIGVDVYPFQVGISLRHVETFGEYLHESEAELGRPSVRENRLRHLIDVHQHLDIGHVARHGVGT